MEKEYLYLSDELIKKGLRPSQQRLKILEYFYIHQNHPSVEDIYFYLRHKMPTLSKATIYNTLKAFEKRKLINEVTIEDNEVRYDLYTKMHGHFKCTECGNIYDFEVEIENIPTKGLQGFEINKKDVYYKGVCSNSSCSAQ